MRLLTAAQGSKDSKQSAESFALTELDLEPGC